ncbi:hypothetical protein AAG747_03315 [Rapidithrix thailandica]|uniref:Gamma-glutamylcyclotransferase AIG2-like domain-containing protein n=1 Tax=Rapidithrix thailandica TaxID=413964 RepID=A0AAW9S3G5_9BACT
MDLPFEPLASGGFVFVYGTMKEKQSGFKEAVPKGKLKHASENFKSRMTSLR